MMEQLVEEFEKPGRRTKYRYVSVQMIFNVIVSIVLIGLVINSLLYKFHTSDKEEQEGFQALKQTGNMKPTPTSEKLEAQCNSKCKVPGPRGMKGEPGLQGENGVPGPDGMKGDRGAKGDRGLSGPQGPQGIRGVSGQRGVSGAPGVRGAAGLPGPPGANGQKGSTGAIGPSGPQGETGAKGDRGLSGPQGPRGIRGVSGQRGVSGAPGVRGPAGLPGPPGADGQKGLTGTSGPQGETGLPGQHGPVGPLGPVGMKGEPGDGIGDVETLTSCNALKNAGYKYNGVYLIDPDGPSTGLDPFSVTCDMTSDLTLGYTLIHHDQEEEGYVKGYEARGSFQVDVTYDLEMNQIKAIKTASTTCKQFIKYKCIHSLFFEKGSVNPYHYWISVDGNRMYNWGGAPTGTVGCKCWVNRKCDDTSRRCNCDSNDVMLRMDQGYLTDKNTLPVTQLRFGDTGGGDEKGFYFLGPLQCA